MDKSEAEFIEDIVGEIRISIPKLVHVVKNMVGMDENLKEVKSLIDAQSNEVSMVGIYGIGGIGKTMIAKVVYNNILDQFECHCFLENVRDKSRDDDGLLKLQEALLCDIIKVKDMKLRNIGEGIEMIKSKCCFEKVLIVLDDVDSPRQLEFLAPNSNCFHQGSIIIVTTRNKRCLDVHQSYSSYEAKVLAQKQAKELLYWKAFQQDHPEDNYVDLCNCILDYAKGLPLALVVLGSFLSQRGVDEWESTLHKIKANPPKDIQEVLRISYDELDDLCKKLFLDIACFFKDVDKIVVTRILEGCKFHPKIALTVLHERCLISIKDDTIRMHDLLQEMGWAIVRQNYPERPEKWSRLWELKILKVYLLKISLLKRLKVIDLSYSRHLVDISSISTCRSLQSLPRNLHKLKCLQTLSSYRCSKIQSFPEIKEEMRSLRELNLSKTGVMGLPSSIRHLNGLEDLDLRCCKNLSSLPDSIGILEALKLLDLSNCKSLESLPEGIYNLSSLKTLKIGSCPKFMGELWMHQRFDEHLFGLLDLGCHISNSGVIWKDGSVSSLKALNPPCLSSLVELSVRNSFLMEQVSGVFYLSLLKNLSLRNFHKIKGGIVSDIVKEIFHLSSLVELSLSNCNLMEVGTPHYIWNLPSLLRLHLRNCNLREGEILNPIWHLSSLEELYLDRNHFSSLPAGLSQLTNLRVLDLSHCKNLQQLPELPSSLRILDAHCSGGISSSPLALPIQSMVNCFKPESRVPCVHPGRTCFEGNGISFVIPRSSGILDWKSYQSMQGHEVRIELPRNWYENKDLLGFALCCVYESLYESTDTSGNEPHNGSAYESENESTDTSDNEQPQE